MAKRKKFRVHKIVRCNCFENFKKRFPGYRFPEIQYYDAETKAVIERLPALVGKPRYFKNLLERLKFWQPTLPENTKYFKAYGFKKQLFRPEHCPFCGMKYDFDAYEKNAKAFKRLKKEK